MNKKWITRILIAIAVVVVLTGVGFVTYRVGYTRGVRTAAVGEVIDLRFVDRFTLKKDTDDDFSGRILNPFQGRPGIPSHNYSGGYFPQSTPFDGRTFTSPFAALFRLAFFGLVLWLGYKLVTKLFDGQGWQLTFTKQPAGDVTIEKEIEVIDET